MRGKIAVLALTALIIMRLSASQALAVNAVTYLGKTTWTATIDTTDPGGQDRHRSPLPAGSARWAMNSISSRATFADGRWAFCLVWIGIHDE